MIFTIPLVGAGTLGNGFFILIVLMVAVAIIIIQLLRSAPSNSKTGWNKKIAALVVVVILVLIGGLVVAFVPLVPYAPTITISQGELTINSQLTGTQSFTSTGVQQAYVQSVGSGILTTMSRQHGQYNGGDYRVGVFTLHNGASSYVVSYNTNDVVVQLKDGSYFVLGPLQQNFTSFLKCFSEDIAPLGNLSSS